MPDDAKKVILITGASSGFGKVSSEFLANHGYLVYAGIRSNHKPENLQKTENLIPVHLDITWSQEKIIETVKEITKKTGRIDVLVNNAGYGLLGPLSAISESELRDEFETNFFGQFKLTQAVLPYMKKQGFGLVIMISSISGLIATAFYGGYSASKFALEAINSAYRFEEASFGINFVSVNPGSHKTDFWKNIIWAKNSPGINIKLQKFVEKIRWHRHDPVNVAKTIKKIIETKNPRKNYLVGQNAKFMNFIYKLIPYFLIDWLGKKLVSKIIR